MKTRNINKRILRIVIPVVLIAGIIIGSAIAIYATRVADTEIAKIEPVEEGFAVEVKNADDISGYEIQYSDSPDFDDGSTETIDTSEKHIQQDNLDGGKKYYVRARAYRDEKIVTRHSSWSTSKEVITKKKIPLEKIIADPAESEIYIGDFIQINVTLEPADTSFKQIKYYTSDSAVATVTDTGTVKGVKEGTATITISVADTDKTANCVITVKKPYVATTGIKITNKKDLSVETGGTITMTASVLPKNATDQNVVWTVDDDTKATISSDGVLKALRPTECVEVTATTQDKKFSQTYKLKITKNKGFLNKSMLDKLNLSSVNNLMIVAHPDDETFWGAAHILHGKYFIVVLTNGFYEQRAEDFNNVIKKYGDDKGIILSYPDIRRKLYDKNGKYKGYETDYWSTCTEGMQADISLLLNYKKWDTVVTHNPDGEYNKFHHKKTCRIVTKAMKGTKNSSTPLYYFGHYYDDASSVKGKRISESDLKKKRGLTKMYLPIAKGAYDRFGHMFPYENWILSTEW